MPKYNVALVLTRRNAYTEAIAESEANPGKPVIAILAAPSFDDASMLL